MCEINDIVELFGFLIHWNLHDQHIDYVFNALWIIYMWKRIVWLSRNGIVLVHKLIVSEMLLWMELCIKQGVMSWPSLRKSCVEIDKVLIYVIVNLPISFNVLNYGLEWSSTWQIWYDYVVLLLILPSPLHNEWSYFLKSYGSFITKN